MKETCKRLLLINSSLIKFYNNNRYVLYERISSFMAVKSKQSLFLCLFMICSCGAFASANHSPLKLPPDSLIRGTVSDSKGPLAGVSVRVKGPRRAGTVTSVDGKFALKAATGDTLTFTFIGYVTQKVPVGRQKNINVTLTEDSKALEDVVVIGYGTQRREKVVGSIAQVTGEQIANRPVSQLKNALTGQLPGVIITTRSGAPGQGSGRISVRGVGSFGGSPDALILVDGIITENFNDIDPNDVETISVLKDASSAAIYGSRAAGGVILVTTKSGKAGKVQVSLNSYVAKQTPTTMPEFVNSWEYRQAYHEAENGTSQLTADQLADVEKFRAQNDPSYPNVDYLGTILSKDAMQTGHNLSVSGGNNTNKYNLAFGYLYQNGMVIKNDYSRYNLRLNMTTTISPKFTLTTRLSAIKSKTNEPYGAAGGSSNDMLNMIGQAARMPGNFPAVFPNGDFGVGFGQGTPISDLQSKSFYWEKALHLTGNVRLDYRVISDLKLSFIAGYNQNQGRNRTFRATQRLNSSLTLGPSSLREAENSNEYYTLQGLAEYNKTFGKHSIGVLAGYSFESYQAENFNAFRDNLPNNDITVLQTGSLENQQSNGTGGEYALESQFARANYSYANKYLIEGVVRRDGSSRFPTNRKYGVFPSVAAGWRIGQERFIKDNVKWVSELKLKASWGVLGNQEIGNYPFQNTLASANNNAYSFGGVIQQGAARTLLVDSTLHWESTRTKDAGIEVGLFANKLTFSASYFDRYTYDILYKPSASVSDILGFGLSERNTGKLKNTGWEFTLGHNNRFGKFSYNVNANFTIIKNRVLDLGVGNVTQANGLVGNGSSLFIGYPMGNNSNFPLYYGYVADGLFVDAADIANYQLTNNQKSINTNPRPGDVRYKDISGPNGVPDGVVNATYDRVVLGSAIPKYSYGINLGAGYGGFDASVLLQGVAGVSGRLQSYASYAFYNSTGNIQRWQYDGRWTEQNPNPNAIYPRVEQIPNTGVPNTLLSSYWVLNAAYLRIKNLQVGYTVPAKTLKSVGISKARIYFSGENLHTFNHYPKGWDPEMNSNGEFYPIMCTYTLGINVTF